jgi:photosystem II stability/assembly factor-like uncharacterized protein
MGTWAVTPALALANGRMPGASDVAFDHADAEHLVARATFGVVQSFDRGKSWQWICEQAIETAGLVADPPVALVADATQVLLPPTGGALLSRVKGCSWDAGPAPLAGKRGVDLTLDPSDAAHLLVLTSTLQHIEDGFGVYENLLIETRDSAQHWSVLATLPADFEAETVEVAASDAQRIYVSGTASRNPRLGMLLRTENGGGDWLQTTMDLPAGTGSLLISAIDPHDADRLWVRVPARGDTIGVLPARLYLSEDKGANFRMLADTKRGMFGFALSPDGTQLAYGGPSDGLFVGPSDGSGTFEKVNSLGVRCLRWPAADALYACGSEPRDKFSLGVSHDDGANFEGLYRMLETCPAECPDDSAFAHVCQEAWSNIRPFVGASGAMCAVPWAAPPPDADAGAPETDAGSPDAGAAERDAGPPEADASGETDDEEDAGANPTGKRAGCSCGLVGAGQNARAMDLSPLALLGLWLARRRIGKRSR